jgi:uncharacterized cupin superfamily protein
MIRLVIGVAVGLVAGITLQRAWEAFQYLRNLPEPSTAAAPLQMRAGTLPRDWVVSGSPRIESAVYGLTTGGPAFAGVWRAEGPVEFDFEYTSNEWLYVMDGDAELDYMGATLHLRPGDTAFFKAGTKARWKVPRRITKTWVSTQPGRVERLFH